MIDLDECEDVVEVGNRQDPSNRLRLAAAIIHGEGTHWLADWLLEEAKKLENPAAHKEKK